MFGKIVKELRADFGMTQAKLAELLGCSQSMIARWEKGECEPTESIILNTAKTFNVSTDTILGYDYEREPVLPYAAQINFARLMPKSKDVKHAWLISKYDAASADIKKAVDKLLS